jgi:hypothetical protein
MVTLRAGVLLALLAYSSARADTIEVSSTTLLNMAKQPRGGVPGQAADLVTVAPAFEILSVSARGVRNTVVDDLTIVVSSWGAYDIKSRRWDNGTTSDLTGDLVAGYVQGKVLARHLTLRLGRTEVSAGVARMIQIDGGEAILTLPAGFRLSGYAGSPVSQRFYTRDGVRTWNAVGGDIAYGGRLGWSYPMAGSPGRGVDLGVSTNLVRDGGDPVREEAALDVRVMPVAALTFTGLGAYSLYDKRPSEITARASWAASKALWIDADYRFVAPDLLLSRNSILSVFSSEQRNFFGGGFTYAFLKNFKLGADYHLEVEPGAKQGDSNHIGSEADGRLEWNRNQTATGLEGFYLDALQNGYWGGRLYARQQLGKFLAAADLLLHEFREKVNGQSDAFTGSLSVGYELFQGFGAYVTGRAGVTPFMEQTFDVLVKLAYNQTYRKTEVR